MSSSEAFWALKEACVETLGSEGFTTLAVMLVDSSITAIENKEKIKIELIQEAISSK